MRAFRGKPGDGFANALAAAISAKQFTKPGNRLPRLSDTLSAMQLSRSRIGIRRR